MSHLTRPARRCANDCSARSQGWAPVRELTYERGCAIIGFAEGIRERCECNPPASHDNSNLKDHTAQVVVYPVRCEPVGTRMPSASTPALPGGFVVSGGTRHG